MTDTLSSKLPNNLLDRVKIVLVNTSDCRNIGSAARAMKTMGLSQLVLVDPIEMPNGQAQALAAGATDVLANAKVVSTLEEAIEDCGLVVGTSARSRTLPWPMLEPRGCGEKMVSEASEYPVALVFGRESSGLTNEELQLCHFHVQIPANPEYSSLNLAMAVQTLSYEIRTSYLLAHDQNYQERSTGNGTDISKATSEDDELFPVVEETERFYQHFEEALKATGFIVPKHPGLVMTKLRRLFNRARPDVKEVKMMRGILASIERTAKNNK
ncbi:tRNA (cytosine(32)/uridine(32)-2'-O)-methyltransferase TrmJ [Colwellia sp. RSH04]|uniref:tRNA (cytosine(32)/uridine(32)-2'-O)-methyltransferase TrmJ n=1 Tax=Colwellia sp. RSH04 TaxID=2305464 RepID=UPI000E57F51E|nr:tRNA (cytosine(32)/uridine(32)-2'-O)-methyltransferase TrmJ [Colwellia sp. RSH04]RHW78011.1 tRNA (cytosine(32)/uridine(32)-2'-O)-methyltransferase TrmJ [Colwellia sp. RSH04]